MWFKPVTETDDIFNQATGDDGTETYCFEALRILATNASTLEHKLIVLLVDAGLKLLRTGYVYFKLIGKWK